MSRRKTTPHFLQNSCDASSVAHGAKLLRKPPARMSIEEIREVAAALTVEATRRGAGPSSKEKKSATGAYAAIRRTAAQVALGRISPRAGIQAVRAMGAAS